MPYISQTITIGNTATETQFYQTDGIASGVLDKREMAFTFFTLKSRALNPGTLTFRARLNGLATPVMEISFTPPVSLATVAGRLNYEVALLPDTPNDPTSVYIQVRGIGEFIGGLASLTPFTIATGATAGLPRIDLTDYDDVPNRPSLRYSWQWQNADVNNVLTIYSHQQGTLI